MAWVIGGTLFEYGDALVATNYWMGIVILWVGNLFLFGALLWVLRQKCRRWCWIFLSWCFAPLWLKNKREEMLVEKVNKTKKVPKVQHSIFGNYLTNTEDLSPEEKQTLICDIEQHNKGKVWY